jgi:hypothetical protein
VGTEMAGFRKEEIDEIADMSQAQRDANASLAAY